MKTNIQTFHSGNFSFSFLSNEYLQKAERILSAPTNRHTETLYTKDPWSVFGETVVGRKNELLENKVFNTKVNELQIFWNYRN